MKLTHKAIARMAGYRIVEGCMEFPNSNLKLDYYHRWVDPETGQQGWPPHLNVEDAWKACCIQNELIEDDK